MRTLRSWLGLLGGLTLAYLPGPAAAQPVGSEFQVNTFTTSSQLTRTHGGHLVASDANGNFVVVWYGGGQGDKFGIFSQRYDSAGATLGTEFRVNSSTTFPQNFASVAAGANGDFVVVWSVLGFENNPSIFGQRFDGAGNALGSEFQVSQSFAIDPPSAAAAAEGAFVVTWTNYRGPNQLDVFGRRYNSAGRSPGT